MTVDPGVPVDYPDSQFEEPDVAAAQLLRNKKITSDAKWTELMMQKLATTIFLRKAYMRTSVKMEDKYAQVKADLLADRDFEGFREKGWQAFQRKWENMVDSFEKRFAITGEGANLSCLDPSAGVKFSPTDQVIYDILKELEAKEEERVGERDGEESNETSI